MHNPFYVQWELRNGNQFFPASETTKQLPAGYYEIKYDTGFGYFFQSIPIVDEQIIQIQAPEFENVVSDIRTFWDKRELYKRNNIVFKRGILLFGVPGTGKSFIIQQITRDLIHNKNGIVITLTSGITVDHYIHFAPAVFRAIEPDRPLIVVLEEIDEIINSRGFHDTAGKLLNMLDGLTQIDNIVYIATTNYIERLQDHFKNRPGRFDVKRKVELPSDEARLHFLNCKLTKEEKEKYDIRKWVKDTKGFSLAHIKELLISVSIMNKDYDQTINTLKSMAQKSSSRDDDSKIGF